MHRVSKPWSVRASIRTATLALAGLVCLGAVQGPALTARAAHRDEQGASHMLALMNRARDRHGIHDLHMDPRLSQRVRRHSAQMARRHRLFHSRNVSRYLRGRHWRRWGENIGEVSGSLRRLEHLFLHSAPHRRNILDGGFHHAGVGVVDSKGKLWVTIVFYG
jgi:uncharacterized protein YkwD